ncbi:MAG: hypothetical protein IJX13_02630, partial [Clostridia bacterium]|nr:hypothetical protein [Clostridia bacterium]
CRYAMDLTQKWSVDITPVKDNRRNGVYDTIAMMEKYDLPWTGILAEGWDLGRNDQDLKELCDYVHSLGKKFLVYIPMGSAKGAEQYAVTQKTPDGNISSIPEVEPGVLNPDRGEGAVYKKYIDITNPFAMKLYLEEFWGRYFDEIGVDGIKVDFCELMPEDYPYNYFDTFGTNIANKGTHHWYPTAYSVMLYQKIAEKADGGMLYIRGGGIGLQRAPYVWGGDQKRAYESLGLQLTAVLSMGMSGLPYFSYDMSGYQYHYSFHGTEEQLMGDTTREIGYESRVFIRGLQYSAFTVCMQMHGSVRNPFDFAEYTRYYVGGQSVMIFYDKEAKREYVYCDLGDGKQNYHIYEDGYGRYVQRGDVKYYLTAVKDGKYAYVTDIYRAYVKLHELLTPYITEQASIASRTGMPLMRHMALHWQDDANVYDINDQYMFGDAFLVCPVLDDKNERDIYLPEGNWLDLNTGTEYSVGKSGKRLAGYDAALTQLPLFYRLENTSDTDDCLLAGIAEIFTYLKEIQSSVH